ncbi:MAG: adenylyl-sulfate kinase [Candidatus Aminicenantes bacterium]|jgi:adenylylsulfate kinase
MTEQKATNITWHQSVLLKEEREKILDQKGVVIWFTGLSGSGKSTLAHAVEEELHKRGHLCYVLDGDNIRHGLNKNLGFSPEDREENIRRIGEVSKLFADAGLVTMTAFISPYRKDRQKARELLNQDDFIEVFMKVPLDVAERRDPKGLYKKARAGEIKEFTGVSAPYEEPLNPELEIDTSKLDLMQSKDIIIRYLEEKKILKKNP